MLYLSRRRHSASLQAPQSGRGRAGCSPVLRAVRAGLPTCRAADPAAPAAHVVRPGLRGAAPDSGERSTGLQAGETRLETRLVRPEGGHPRPDPPVGRAVDRRTLACRWHRLGCWAERAATGPRLRLAGFAGVVAGGGFFRGGGAVGDDGVDVGFGQVVGAEDALEAGEGGLGIFGCGGAHAAVHG